MRDLSKKRKLLNDDIRIGKNTIDQDAYDIFLFDEIKKNNPKIKNTETDGTKGYAPFKELHQDLFDALFKYAPKQVPENQIMYSHLLNSEIMSEILKSPQYKELRNLTRLDSIAATVGTEIMGEQVQELIKDLKEKFDELVKQLEQAAKDAADAQKGEGPGEGEEGGPGGDKTPGKEKIKYAEAQKRLEEHLKQVKALVNKKEIRAINKILENAVNESRATSDLITNWGLDASDTFTKSSYQEKLKLLERLRNSTKLKQIAELAGRYKRMAIQTQREKVKRGMDEVYDIIPGRDLGKLLASEKMKLLHPITKLLFKKDFLEGKTLQYETSGKEKKQKGPVIICIDDSGSMSGQNEII